MCGRYAIVDGKKIFSTFENLKNLEERGKPFELLPRYNASPTDSLPVIAVRNGRAGVERMRWWLIPHTSFDGKPVSGSDGRPLSAFNAKAESIDASRMFGQYFASARCLVPADAFYEWKKNPTTAVVRGRTKNSVERLPFAFRMKDERMFMFAGIFSVWRNDQGEEFPSFSIITTEPNELMRPIHNRMPVILHELDFDAWLDRNNNDKSSLKRLLAPFPAEKMTSYPVSRQMNSSRYDQPDCLSPVGEGEEST